MPHVGVHTSTTDDSVGTGATVAAPSAGGFDVSVPEAHRLPPHGSKSVDVVRQAEQFCLNRVHATFDDILQLISLLDSEAPSRGQVRPNSFSWTSGAYAKGPLRGLRKHSTSFPACTRLLCKLKVARPSSPRDLFGFRAGHRVSKAARTFGLRS